MNIDDLENDIEDMESDGEGATKKCNDMIEIKDAYYENKKECAYLIEEFKDNYGQKINII